MVDCQLHNVTELKERFRRLLPSLNPGAVILEIGCFAGGSLERWIDVLNEGKATNKLLAVDPYDNPNNYLGRDAEGLMKEMIEILRRYPHGEFFRVKSDEFFGLDAERELSENQLGFCLIDGMHTEEQMRRDIGNVSRWMDRPSLLVIDDVSWAPQIEPWLEVMFESQRMEWLPGDGKARHQLLVYYE